MNAHHYSITVSDLEKHLEFYRDTLGFDEVYETELDSERFAEVVGVEDATADMIFLDGNGILIELFEYHPDGGRIRETPQSSDMIGAHHIAFEVEDADETYEALSDDVEFVNPVTIGGTGAKAAYMYDPDGNVVEIFEEGTMPVQSPEDV